MRIGPGPLYLYLPDEAPRDPQEPTWTPPGTPRCVCGCVLLPLSLSCPLCDVQRVDADTPLQVDETPLPAGTDPLDLYDPPPPFWGERSCTNTHPDRGT